MLISDKIGAWSEANPRDLPWTKTTDPYKIWLSEIIMQQTRVAQGTGYYHKFIDLFPTVTDLANAPEDDVMKAWEGLGYYSRARNLHFSAKMIRDQYSGQFPSTYKEILALKGVGPYSAAAISSFAYDLPYAAVDGNVTRVIARLYGITDGVDLTSTKKHVQQLADLLLKEQVPKKHNQAMIDFGALVCTPRQPKCTSCPVQEKCTSYKENLVEIIPTKVKKIKRTKRYFHYLHLSDNTGLTLINRRGKSDIWQGLYELPLLETKDNNPLEQHYMLKELGITLESSSSYQSITLPKHVLSHQDIYATVHKVSGLIKEAKRWQVIQDRDITNFAFPRLIDKYLADQHGIKR